MWSGWGSGPGQTWDTEAHQRQTIQVLKQGSAGAMGAWSPVGEPCSRSAVRKALSARRCFLPYGVIEGEPSYPATNLRIDGLRPQFDDFAAKYPELAGMMGNVQTPLLQFPHMYYFTSAMLDAEYRNRSEREVLLDLCGHLYPEHKELLADCYVALKESEPGQDPVAGRST